MMGININCSERDFVALIMAGDKWIETRRTPSLRPYVGKTVGLVRTGKGPAMLCGYADIIGEIVAETWGKGACVDGTSYQRPGYGYVIVARDCRPQNLNASFKNYTLKKERTRP